MSSFKNAVYQPWKDYHIMFTDSDVKRRWSLHLSAFLGNWYTVYWKQIRFGLNLPRNKQLKYKNIGELVSWDSNYNNIIAFFDVSIIHVILPINSKNILSRP